MTHCTINKYHRNKIISEINITPLVDVMLVLLIIFMVTSPMLMAGINVDLPQTQSTPLSNDQDDPLVISINAKGHIYIMETLISKQELLPKLKAIVKEKYDHRIFIKGDKNIHYGKIIEVIGELNSAGFNKVALITNIKTDEQK